MTSAAAQRLFAGLRAQFARQFPAARGVRFEVHERHFLAKPSSRDFAWFDLNTRTICLTRKALRGAPGRVAGLLAHELGHACDPRPGTAGEERRADSIAEAVLGQPLLYDGGDVQNLDEGSAPRPPHLPERRAARNPAAPALPLAEIVEAGALFKTGAPVAFIAMHNTQGSGIRRALKGDPFQQKLEPSGRYMLHNTTGRLPQGWVELPAVFGNPLVLWWADGDSYDDTSWKARLSKHFKAKGEALRQRLLREGYDAVVTVQRASGRSPASTSEIIDLHSLGRVRA